VRTQLKIKLAWTLVQNASSLRARPLASAATSMNKRPFAPLERPKAARPVSTTSSRSGEPGLIESPESRLAAIGEKSGLTESAAKYLEMQARPEQSEVPTFTIPRTLVDCFRHRRSVGANVAIGALREALRQRTVPPAAVAECARERGAWSLKAPYLEALTLDG